MTDTCEQHSPTVHFLNDQVDEIILKHEQNTQLYRMAQDLKHARELVFLKDREIAELLCKSPGDEWIEALKAILSLKEKYRTEVSELKRFITHVNSEMHNPYMDSVKLKLEIAERVSNF